MTCPDPFERFRGHLIPVEVEARPSPDSSELSHFYYGQMLDIKKELEKFNRLLEEVEDDDVRTRAATDTDASESGGINFAGQCRGYRFSRSSIRLDSIIDGRCRPTVEGRRACA